MAQNQQLKLIFTSVVGMKYRFKTEAALQKAMRKFQVGEEVSLIREPTNSHDPHAIQVFLKKKHIGYVPKDEAIELRTLDLSNFKFFFFDYKAVSVGANSFSSTEIIGVPRSIKGFKFKDLVLIDFYDLKIHPNAPPVYLSQGDRVKVTLLKTRLSTIIDRLELVNVSQVIVDYLTLNSISKFDFYMYEIRNVIDPLGIERVRMRVIGVRGCAERPSAVGTG